MLLGKVERISKLVASYFFEGLFEDSVTKLLVHDDEASRTHKQFAHLGQSGLLQSKRKQIQNNLLVNDSLAEGVVILFGICEVFYVYSIS